MLKLYELSKHKIAIPTAKMKVILMPDAVMTLVSRFDEAIHPFNFNNRTSPLLNKFDQQIFSDKLTIYQDPLDDSEITASTFDDEGVARQKTIFVEKGVFKRFYSNLKYAAQLKTTSTGNAERGVEEQPAASVGCYRIATGDQSLEEMTTGIDDGIIVYNAYPPAGDILRGDYSAGVRTGFYIKNGKMIGMLKDCMITGNIYETFNHIMSIENKTHYLGHSNFPAIAFDEISVSGGAE